MPGYKKRGDGAHSPRLRTNAVGAVAWAPRPGVACAFGPSTPMGIVRSRGAGPVKPAASSASPPTAPRSPASRTGAPTLDAPHCGSPVRARSTSFDGRSSQSFSIPRRPRVGSRRRQMPASSVQTGPPAGASVAGKRPRAQLTCNIASRGAAFAHVPGVADRAADTGRAALRITGAGPLTFLRRAFVPVFPDSPSTTHGIASSPKRAQERRQDRPAAAPVAGALWYRVCRRNGDGHDPSPPLRAITAARIRPFAQRATTPREPSRTIRNRPRRPSVPSRHSGSDPGRAGRRPAGPAVRVRAPASFSTDRRGASHGRDAGPFRSSYGLVSRPHRARKEKSQVNRSNTARPQTGRR